MSRASRLKQREIELYEEEMARKRREGSSPPPTPAAPERPAHELARERDPGTSKEAAGQHAKQRESNRLLCLRAYASPEAAKLGGLTDDEVSVVTGLEPSAAWRRCADLRKFKDADGDPLPLIEPVPNYYRNTRRKSRARVCVITAAGRAFLA